MAGPRKVRGWGSEGERLDSEGERLDSEGEWVGLGSRTGEPGKVSGWVSEGEWVGRTDSAHDCGGGGV